MNKQRLMELAGVVVEARHAGDTGEHFIIMLDHGYGQVEAYGPFPSKDVAEEFVNDNLVGRVQRGWEGLGKDITIKEVRPPELIRDRDI